jgi:hypothetical protein
LIRENSDQVALIAQADIDRFFIRVIRPALGNFAPGPDVPGGIVDDMDTFLDRAKAATHNALCYEMRRTFGLTIGALFERQLRFWLGHGAPSERARIESARFPSLGPLITELRGISLASSGRAADLNELWLLANAVRHGEGPAVRNLAKIAPALWAHLSEEAASSRRVDNIRVSDSDLERYTVAVMKFWWAAGASSIEGVTPEWFLASAGS